MASRHTQGPPSGGVGISLREFARREGCSDTLVRKALKSGHLQALADGKLDPALVGSDWRQANRRKRNDGANSGANPDGSQGSQAPIAPLAAPPTSAPELEAIEADADAFIKRVLAGNYAKQFEAEAIKENALALKHVLEARRLAGVLIEMADAETLFFEQAREMRDAWLNWPARIGPLIAAALGIDADKLTEALTGHVHTQLDDLGEPDFAGALENVTGDRGKARAA